MKIQQTKMKILSIDYGKEQKGNAISSVRYFYYAKARALEITDKPTSTEYNLYFALHKSQYLAKPIKSGDIVDISEECFIKSTTQSFTTNNPSLLKNLSTKDLKQDERGNTYGRFDIDNFVVCIPQSEWYIDERGENLYYGKLPLINYYIPYLSDADFKQTVKTIFIDEADYKKLSLFDNQTTYFEAYVKRKFKNQWKIRLNAFYNERIDKYVLQISRNI